MNARRSATPTASRRALAGTIAALLVVLGATAVLAQGDLGGKVRAGGDIRVAADETVATDLYVFGGTVTVDGTVQGDLVASGGTVTLNGTVDGDVLAAGGTLRIGGDVTGDVRAAGGQVVVAGPVREDGLIAGGQVELASDGSIGEDLIVSGGQVTVAGDVSGSITGTAGAYSRSGSVGGTDEVEVRAAEPPFDRAPDLVGDAVRHFLSVLLVGLVALWLAPRIMSFAETTVRRRPVSAVGWGIGALLGFLLLIVAIPIIVVLVAIVLALLGFGGLVGLDVLAGIVAVLGLILAFTLGGFFLADVIVALALAFLVSPDPAATTGAREGRGWLTARTVLMLVVGVAVVVIVTAIPVIGPVARLAVVILGLGALLFALWRRWRGGRDDVVVVDEGRPPATASPVGT